MRSEDERNLPPGITTGTTRKGQFWQVRYNAAPPGSPRDMKKKTFYEVDGGERAAREFQEEQRVLVRHHDWVEVTEATLGQLCDAWLAEMERVRKSQTFRTYRNGLKQRFGPLMKLPAANVTRAQIRELVTEGEAKGLSAETIAKGFQPLREVFARAVADQVLRHNPCEGIALPTYEQGPVRVLSRSERPLVRKALAGTPYEDLWLLCWDGMLRIGEALALDWNHIDWTAGTVAIRRTMAVDAGGHLFVQDFPKTMAGYRQVPLAERTLALLRSRRAGQQCLAKAEERVWSEWSPLFPGRGASGRVVRLTVAKELRVRCEALGIMGVHPHTLRHTGATECADAGVAARVLAKVMGHKSVVTCQDRYYHPDEQTLSEEMARVESTRFGAKLGHSRVPENAQ